MISKLSAKGLVKIYGKRRVVDGADVELKRGEVVGLLGPNGAGKTTTFYMIAGLIKPQKGEIYFDDINCSQMPMYKRARLGLRYLPQEPSVFRKLTVEQNVMAMLELLGISRKERKRKLTELLDELNITHLAKQKAFTLSGGERRRVEITRALVGEPSFMLLDEPFTGIDPIAVNDIQNIISKLKEKGIGILITDHRVRETLSITDRAYIMDEGVIKISGTSEQLANDPKAKEIYLGEKFKLD